MKLTKSRTLRFNMARFEHIEISATVEVDTSELDHTHQGAVKYINELLDDMLREDVERATLSTVTPEDDTFVHEWKELTDGTNS